MEVGGLKNQSLYHKILLLQKFNDISGKVLKPKRNSASNLKKNEKWPHFFLRLEADFLGALKPSPRYHETSVKVRFLDKVTGLWAFEGQMSDQK